MSPFEKSEPWTCVYFSHKNHIQQMLGRIDKRWIVLRRQLIEQTVDLQLAHGFPS
jgi:hypothetical protein